MALEILFKVFSIRLPLKRIHRSIDKKVFEGQFKAIDKMIEQRKVENIKLILKAGVDPFRPI